MKFVVNLSPLFFGVTVELILPRAPEIEPTTTSLYSKTPLMFRTYNALDPVSSLNSVPTTTAVAPETSPVIISPRFKATKGEFDGSLFKRRAASLEEDPAFLLESNCVVNPETSSNEILVAGVINCETAAASKYAQKFVDGFKPLTLNNTFLERI